jgi:hypothetical protein
LTLGTYNNFPPNVHYLQTYVSTVSGRQLQQKIIQFLAGVNRKELSFEEISVPTIPSGQVIFEFGLAEEGDFNYLSSEEAESALALIAMEHLASLDFFCSVRYYKVSGGGRQALKFDYYMLRTLFAKGSFEVQVFHERGPRYLSPEDLVEFIFQGINGGSNREILKESNT